MKELNGDLQCLTFFRQSIWRRWIGWVGLAAFAASSVFAAEGIRTVDSINASFFASKSPAVIEITIATNLFPNLNKTNREYVLGNISVGTTRLERVGFRLKGWSSFQPLQFKPNFAVKFNESLPGQRLGGLSKLFLNNSKQDSSCLREPLANELFRDGGVPAPRTRFARVVLNGRNLGTYVAIEAMNKDFLRRNFGDSSGNLYEGFMQDIGGELELDNGTDRTYADLKALQTAALQPEPQVRWQEVSRCLDVDRFMMYAALNVFLGVQDSYVFNANNYRIYHDPNSEKFVFIPHGLDTTFICGRGIEPPTNVMLMKSLLGLRQGQELYRSNLWYLATNIWDVARITNRIAESARQLVELSTTDAERRQQLENVEMLSAQVTTRRQEVLAALSQPSLVKLEFDTHGTAPLTNWFPATFTFSPWFHVLTNAEGVFLKIDAPYPTVGMWRTHVSLPEGDYVFECRAKTQGRSRPDGVSPSAARVVVVGPPMVDRSVSDDGRWQDVALRFAVPHGGCSMDLICEHSVGAGVSLFDLRSLRIRRR